MSSSRVCQRTRRRASRLTRAFFHIPASESSFGSCYGISRDLLDLECSTIGATWLPGLSKELKKPYFKNLKQFLRREGVEYSSALEKQKKSNKVFPQAQDVYSWSRHTRLDQLKVVILGQDPYHNIDQAHGELHCDILSVMTISYALLACSIRTCL